MGFEEVYITCVINQVTRAHTVFIYLHIITYVYMYIHIITYIYIYTHIFASDYMGYLYLIEGKHQELV